MLGSCTIDSCGGCEYYWEPYRLWSRSTTKFLGYDREDSGDILNYRWSFSSKNDGSPFTLFFCKSCHNYLIITVLFAALKKGDMRFECDIPR